MRAALGTEIGSSLVIRWNTLFLGEYLHLLSRECSYCDVGQFSFYPVGHWFSTFPPQSVLQVLSASCLEDLEFYCCLSEWETETWGDATWPRLQRKVEVTELYLEISQVL